MQVCLGVCACLECRPPPSLPSSSCRPFKSRERRVVSLIPTSSPTSEFFPRHAIRAGERLSSSSGGVHGLSRWLCCCQEGPLEIRLHHTLPVFSFVGVRWSSTKVGRNGTMGGSRYWAPPRLVGTWLLALGLGALEHRLGSSLAGSSPGLTPLLYWKQRRGSSWRGFSSSDVRGSSVRSLSPRIFLTALSYP